LEQGLAFLVNTPQVGYSDYNNTA